MAQMHVEERRPSRVVATLEPWWSERMLDRIQSEYREMPGLNLTVPQARRLFGLIDIAPCDCQALLDHLVAQGFLRRTSAGAYVLRADW